MKTAWMDTNFCRRYLKSVRISTTDIHYGYLAPGEKELGLLGNDLGRAKILEVGCGAGHNSIALAKLGAACTAIDMSEEMIRQAKRLAKKEKVAVVLICGDALYLSAILPEHHRESFDIAISSHSLGFMPDIASIFKQINLFLKPDGKFVFCVSHPSQAPQQPTSLRMPVKKQRGWAENYLTINQAIEYLSGAGFLVDRVVEQTTRNPSRLSPEEKSRFPYEPLKLSPLFDPLTYSPHTIIYACRKVESLKKP